MHTIFKTGTGLKAVAERMQLFTVDMKNSKKAMRDESENSISADGSAITCS